MTRSEQLRLFEEINRRKRWADLLVDLHDGQRRYLFAQADGKLAPYVGLLSARRFGKTRGFLHLGVHHAATVARSRVVLIYQKRKDARKIAWPILDELVEDYQVPAKANRLDLQYRFHNGSTVELDGADDPGRHRQFRGQRNDLVLIDEAQDWYSDVEQLVQWMIPGVTDRRGRIFLAGTPGPLPEGYFFEVMSGRHGEWCLQRGDPFENPHTAQQMQERLDQLCTKNPEVINEPWIRREFFGEWVVDTRMNIVKIKPALNYLTEWERKNDDQFIIVGNWRDSQFSVVVATYNTLRYPHLIFIEAHKTSDDGLGRQKDLLVGLISKYPDAVVHASPDPSSRTIAKSLREMHGVPITPLGREDRFAEIELMNMATTVGDVKVFNSEKPSAPEASPLITEWESLVWVKDRRTGAQKEGEPRHLHECALYARRVAHNHLFEEKPEPIMKGSPEWHAEQEKELRRRKMQRYARRSSYTN